MQENKDASRCTGSVASDARNQSPEQAGKKKSFEKLVQHAFHVINVTLFGSRGPSNTNWLSSGSSKVSIPRFARFREDSNLGSCINFQRKPRRTNSSHGARAASEFFCHNVTRLCCRVFRPRQEDEERAKASWTPRQSTTKAGICLTSDCQFRKSSCPNRTSSKHKRMWTASSSPSAAA